MDPELPVKLAFPPYVAVTVSDPIGKLLTANLAVPPDRVAVPSVVDPWVKVTVPKDLSPREKELLEELARTRGVKVRT